jgi:hypothetical protein
MVPDGRRQTALVRAGCREVRAQRQDVERIPPDTNQHCRSPGTASCGWSCHLHICCLPVTAFSFMGFVYQSIVSRARLSSLALGWCC